MDLTEITLTELLANEALLQLIAQASGPRPDLPGYLARFYGRADSRLFVDPQGLGILGLHAAGPAAVITHIAVDPSQRGRGLGRELIAAAAHRLGLQTLTAETDRSAVDFYRRCGFAVTSLGEKYPGVERFQCVLHR